MQANGITVTRDENNFKKIYNRDKRISLKAKGLLGLVIDLPRSWDFSIAGLISICKEEEDAIRSAIRELKQFGYVAYERSRDDKGHLKNTSYHFYENPADNPNRDFPDVDNPDVENPNVENPDANIKEVIKNKNNKREGGKTPGGDGLQSKADIPPLASPSVSLWLKVTGEAVSREAAILIEKRVKSLRAWEDCLEGWVASGWNKLNVAGQLNRYDKMIRENDYPEDEETSTGETVIKEKEEDFKDLIFS
jgi:hypothetical protein